MTTNDPRLDRVYEEDWRGLNYPMMLALPTYPLRSYTWPCNYYNDQGQEGACVGFGWGHELCARPMVVPVDAEFSRYIYQMAKEIDEWDGNDYEGTSVLAGAKVIKNMGHLSEYRWALTLQDWVSGVGHKGPAVLGVNWYEGMFEPDSRNYVHVTGSIIGGHCILCRGVSLVWRCYPRTFENLDLDRSSFLLHNSWGTNWGRNGTARVSLSDANKLLLEKAEVCFPIRVKQ